MFKKIFYTIGTQKNNIAYNIDRHLFKTTLLGYGDGDLKNGYFRWNLNVDCFTITMPSLLRIDIEEKENTNNQFTLYIFISFWE